MFYTARQYGFDLGCLKSRLKKKSVKRKVKVVVNPDGLQLTLPEKEWFVKQAVKLIV